jgi:Na+-translocating ferredoxin:NAD+ oxidoreductase RnfG subunit
MKLLQYSLSVPVLVASAHAAQFLTVEQAQRLFFPAAASFAEKNLELTGEQLRQIERQARSRMRLKRYRIWEALAQEQRLGWFIVDEVYGKHEFITYATALDPSGAVLGIEILVYRESYGGEIRNPQWRAQFVGKRSGDGLELDKEIRNISGATLSCQHITEGVRRLLALHRVALGQN